MTRLISLVVADGAELSHIYRMADFFFLNNRGYEVCLKQEVEVAPGTKQWVMGKGSDNTLQVAGDKALADLKAKAENAPRVHAAHMEMVGKYGKATAPVKEEMPSFTADDLDFE